MAMLEHNSARKAVIREQVMASQEAWASKTNPAPSDPAMIHAWLDWHTYSGDTAVLTIVHKATARLLADWKNPSVYPAQGNPELLDLLFDLVQLSGLPIYKEGLVHLASVPLDGTPLQQVYPYLMAWAMTGQQQYKKEVDRLMDQIQEGIQPGGAWSSYASASRGMNGHYPYQVDDQLLLLKIYNRLLTLTGLTSYADQAERLALNALAGFTHPDHEGWTCTREVNTPTDPDGQIQTSYILGEAPGDASCLTTLLAVHPELAKHAWLQDSQGLVQPYFIPGEFNTRIHDRPVRITATSEFPGDHRMDYIVQTDSLHAFRIKIRKPDWVKAITIDQPYRLEANYIVMEGPWSGFDEVHLVFIPSVGSHRTPQGERWFSFGPLVLTHPLLSTDTLIGSSLERRLISHAREDTGYELGPTEKAKRAFGSDAADLRFSLEARNPVTGQTESIRMAPLARTTNRQTTFPSIR